MQFALSVEQARAGKRAQLREHCPIAFNNYLTWFLASTRVEVCKPAYAEEILEEPTVFDEVAQHQYNALVRKGNSVIPSAPMMNFVVFALFAFHSHYSHLRLPNTLIPFLFIACPDQESS